MAVQSVYANQSVTIREVLSAFRGLVKKALNWADERVISWHGEGRPDLTKGRSVVWFRFVDREPVGGEGPNRHGQRCDVIMEANLITRSAEDQAQADDRVLATHLNDVFYLENSLFGRMLHREYQDRVVPEPPMPVDQQLTADDVQNRRWGVTDANYQLVSIACMTAVPLDKPDLPRQEQGYLQTRLRVRVPVVLRLTLNDEPPPAE